MLGVQCMQLLENSLPDQDVYLYHEALLTLKSLLDWQPQLLATLLTHPGACTARCHPHLLCPHCMRKARRITRW